MDAVTFPNVTFPNPPQDEFDKDITGSVNEGNEDEDFDFAEMPSEAETFHALWHTLQTMMQAGWTEAQAIRFLAFCAIYEGD